MTNYVSIWFILNKCETYCKHSRICSKICFVRYYAHCFESSILLLYERRSESALPYRTMCVLWYLHSYFWTLPTRRLPNTSLQWLNRKHIHCRQIWRCQCYISFAHRLQDRKHIPQIFGSSYSDLLVQEMISTHSYL